MYSFSEWNQQLRTHLIESPPCSRDDLFHRDFGVVRGARLLVEEAERSLYVTLSYQLFWLHVEGAQVVSIECLDAAESESLFWHYYYDFPVGLIQKAESCFTLGATLPVAFQNYNGNALAPPKANIIHSDDVFERRVYTLRHFPPLRAAFLQVDVGPDENILSTRLLTGEKANARRIESLKR